MLQGEWESHSLMLLSVHVGEVDAFLTHVLLHGWIHGQFLTYSVPSQGPGELVAPLDLLLQGIGGPDLFSVAVNECVVGANGLANGLAFRHGVWYEL